MKLGRPLKYQTIEELDAAIEAYFEDRIARDKPATMASLAIALGFSSRASLWDYEERPTFSAAIKRARFRVEAGVEELVVERGNAGQIFWLKNNAGYNDQTQHQHTGSNGGPIATVDVTEAMTDDELERIARGG